MVNEQPLFFSGNHLPSRKSSGENHSVREDKLHPVLSTESLINIVI